MALSLDQFAGQIVDSGVLSADEVSVCRAASSAQDAEQFARELVRQKKLTAFQAQQLYSGKGKSLVLGNYVVLDKLGQGGMGMVLKARHRRMDRLVALKVLSPTVVKTPDLLARFHREVKAAARLEHPNIVSAYDADEARGTHFFVMQFVEGSDLASVVKKKGPLPVDHAVNSLLQAARGLDYAHKHGVIHRDIKPANLLLDSHGTVKILDMGLARIEGETGSQAELTSTGAVMGTVDYMAPEQALSTKSADARSDVYSLGITLWYLLIGRPAYEGDSLMARLLAHRESPVPSLKGARGEIPEALDSLFRKMVAKAPKDRFQSMAEVVAALDTCLKGDIDGGANAPSITRGPTEDSKLSNFLGLFGGGTDPMAATATAPRSGSTAAVGAAAPGSEYEATVTSAPSSEGTDPATLTNLARSRTSPVRLPAGPRATKWLLATGVLALLLGAFFFGPSRQRAVDGVAARPENGNPSTDHRDAGPPSSVPAAVDSLDPQDPALTAAEKVLVFDGVDDYVELPNFRMANEGPITVEAWIVPAAWKHQSIITAPGTRPFSLFTFDDRAGFWSMGTEVTMPTDGIPSGQLVHVAGVYDDSKLTVFLNGEPSASVPPLVKTADTEAPAYLGAIGDWEKKVERRGFLDGSIRAVRVSGKALYTGKFTPAWRVEPRAKQFENDSETLALYHFDEGAGSVLKDSSGHAHHGRIVGATWRNLSPSGGPSSPPAGPVAGVRANDGQQSRPTVPQKGLDFNFPLSKGTARVNIPPIQEANLPLTVEMFVTPRSAPESSRQNRLVFGIASQLMLVHRKEGWRWHGSDPKDQVVGNAVMNRRTHLAAVSVGGELRLYADGKQTGRVSLTKPVDPTRFSILVGGQRETLSTWEPLDAVIDGIRVSTTARYDMDFPVPERLAADPDTRALYLFEEGQGDSLQDVSGHGHHATIVGAKWVGAADRPTADPASGNGNDGQAADRVIDPLAAIDPARLTYRPDFVWRREGNRLIGEGRAKDAKSDWIGSGFGLGVEGDYDVELDLLQQHCYPLQIDLPLRDRAIRIDLSGGGCGLLTIDGKDGGEFGPPYRHKDVKLKDGVVQSFAAKVRFRGEEITVEATLDGERVGKYEGLRSRVGLPHWVKPNLKDVKVTFLGDISRARVEFHRARVRPVESQAGR